MPLAFFLQYINNIISAGSAIGFRLDSLLKLTDTRARNKKMTLMHYLCKVEYFFVLAPANVSILSFMIITWCVFKIAYIFDCVSDARLPTFY